jgi:hypothetical protein
VVRSNNLSPGLIFKKNPPDGSGGQSLWMVSKRIIDFWSFNWIGYRYKSVSRLQSAGTVYGLFVTSFKGYDQFSFGPDSGLHFKGYDQF